jgi:hypothetical protein
VTLKNGFQVYENASSFELICVHRMLFNGVVNIETISFDDGMINEYGAVGGMRTGRGNQSTPTSPAPVPLCTQHIPYALISD